MNSKCEMARLKYCRKSYLGFCNAEEEDINRCPYAIAVEEIAKLAIENVKLEYKYLDDGK